MIWSEQSINGEGDAVGVVRWGDDRLSLTISWTADAAPALTAVDGGGVVLTLPPGLPLVEIVTVADGHAPASGRLVHSTVGARARYVDHRIDDHEDGSALRLRVRDDLTGLVATAVYRLTGGTGVLRCEVEVGNDGPTPVALRSVASWSGYLGRPSADGTTAPDWVWYRADNDWLGENRWSAQPLDASVFPSLRAELTGHHPRGALVTTSTGTWSTGRQLPVAAVTSAAYGATWAWQIDHNGGWRYEFGQDADDLYLALSGPTDDDHQWLRVLAPGDRFTSVPVAITLAPDLTAAVARLTRHRRAVRRGHADNQAMPVIFNDYMNTLNGDPTTARLLPLIDAAAEVGAEVFCIDAGWYDDSGFWWDSVGEWQPSVTRFPGGLSEVVHRIRELGMVPGLWLEPEVVGVNSPVADTLPAEAFLQRAGQRVVEHSRYHLDLRHPAARAHLDAVVDRLVSEFGVGFFKLDYNINPGPGTDRDADSVGDGLLGHNRAHLAWLEGVLDRHPQLIIENCGSGGMRADGAVLARVQLQSTSDQQDPVRYPPIAAAAPAAMLPEQAASWAYPQPSMTPEEAAFTLTTGLAGRIYLSGYLNEMSAGQRELVAEGVRMARRLRPVLTRTTPVWPLGLPGWDDPWVCLALDAGDEAYVFCWDRRAGLPNPDRHGSGDSIDLSLADLTAAAPAGWQVDQVFPATLPSWRSEWSPERRTLTLSHPGGEVGARVLRLTPRPPQTT